MSKKFLQGWCFDWFYRFCEHEKPTSYYPAYSFQRMKVFLDFIFVCLIFSVLSFAILIIILVFSCFSSYIFNVLWGCSIAIFSNFVCLPGVVLSCSGQQIPKQWSHLQNQMRWSYLGFKRGYDRQLPNIYVSTVGRYCSIHLFACSVIFIPCNIF